MPRFVVLLRGVNVGKGNRIAMADFRGLLEALGFGGVRTLLNSGNAVVDSPGRSAAGHAHTIADALRERLGLTVPVVVRSAADLAAAVADNPLAPDATDPARLIVAFAQAPQALQDLAALHDRVRPPERLVIGRQAAYLHCPDGILQSRAGAALLGPAGRQVTTRNWATVLKLHDLLRATGDGPA